MLVPSGHVTCFLCDKYDYVIPADGPDSILTLKANHGPVSLGNKVSFRSGLKFETWHWGCSSSKAYLSYANNPNRPPDFSSCWSLSSQLVSESVRPTTYRAHSAFKLLGFNEMRIYWSRGCQGCRRPRCCCPRWMEPIIGPKGSLGPNSCLIQKQVLVTQEVSCVRIRIIFLLESRSIQTPSFSSPTGQWVLSSQLTCCLSSRFLLWRSSEGTSCS